MAYALTDGIKDIKPPFDFETGNYLLTALLISIILTLLVLTVIYTANRFRRRKPKRPEKPVHVLAYEALEDLKKRNLPAHGRVKEYFFELSLIVRHYIEDRFHINAPEMTTEEFLSTLRGSDLLEDAHRALLKDFLNLCDIVKFAKHNPRQNEIEESYNTAKAFIDKTKEVSEEGEPIK